MTKETIALIDLAIRVVLLVFGVVAFYQFREAKKKRHIDMYWKIAEIYAAPTQRNAKYDASVILTQFINKYSDLNDLALTKLYNSQYHEISLDNPNKKIDISVMDRIRFLNQIGILVKRKLIDKDMLFGLIGIGLELDYNVLDFVLKAHSQAHNVPDMHKEMRTTWKEYNKWKKN